MGSSNWLLVRTLFQTHATTTLITDRSFLEKLDARKLECSDQFGERVDIAANKASAGLHPLNGRNRELGELRELFLVEVQQSTRRSKLICRDHASDINSNDLDIIYTV